MKKKYFLATVKLSKRIAVRKEETLKKKTQVEKTQKFLDMCKKHEVQSHSHQLLADVGYLRCTIHIDMG